MASNKNNKKRWVFECLVEGDNDPVGFIAYSFYKKSKHELAVRLREDGETEAVIQDRVKMHHENAVRSQETLDSYKKSATVFLSEVTDRIAEEVRNEFKREHEQSKREWERKTAALEKEKSRALTQATNQLKAAAKEYKKPSAASRFGSWLLNGFSELAASLILVLVVGGFFGGQLLTK
ncbi:hypothetical protein [Pseudidiomarina halophila]|uniref:hypothetical protein n=1 Tax=Pseudidiomarina halophila TaxID=1449799 RepID=UPI00362117E2